MQAIRDTGATNSFSWKSFRWLGRIFTEHGSSLFNRTEHYHERNYEKYKKS